VFMSTSPLPLFHILSLQQQAWNLLLFHQQQFQRWVTTPRDSTGINVFLSVSDLHRHRVSRMICVNRVLSSVNSIFFLSGWKMRRRMQRWEMIVKIRFKRMCVCVEWVSWRFLSTVFMLVWFIHSVSLQRYMQDFKEERKDASSLFTLFINVYYHYQWVNRL